MATRLWCATCAATVRSKWAGELILVGEALSPEPVGVIETEGGDWLVRYADVELGYNHPQRRRLSPRPLRGAHSKCHPSIRLHSEGPFALRVA